MSNTVKCPACGFAACRATIMKTGGYSLSCTECSYQGFARSPKAAAGIAAQLGGNATAPAATPAPAAPAKKSSGLLIDD